jgi:hypothetical protein
VRGASPGGAPLGVAVEVAPTTAALCAGGAAALLPAGGGGALLWVSARARAGAEALARRAVERLLGARAPPLEPFSVEREGAESAALWRALGGAREADPADAGAADSEDSEEGLETRCAPPPLPPSRTKWTRLVHPSVLTGYVSSTPQAVAARASRRAHAPAGGADPRSGGRGGGGELLPGGRAAARRARGRRRALPLAARARRRRARAVSVGAGRAVPCSPARPRRRARRGAAARARGGGVCGLPRGVSRVGARAVQLVRKEGRDVSS